MYGGHRSLVVGTLLALVALPKSAHQDARAALAEIYNAEDRDHAEQAAKAFAAAYGAKWPKGVPSIPPTSSRLSEPARSSRTASSSNAPTNQQAVTLTPHDTLIHRP